MADATANDQPPSLEQVCEQALKLPCSPSLLPRLVTALNSEDSSAEEIESIISLDPALAAATLRIANSAYYGTGEPIAALSEAIMRLGQKEIYRLAALILVGRWESVHKDNLRWEPGDYARHSLCTALAAEVLAENSGAVDAQAAYTAGLVCDLGKLALAYVCAKFYPRISAHSKGAGCTWEEAEKAVLGYHNVEVGVQLLRAWRFPDYFTEAVEGQTHPASSHPDVRVLVAHLHAARYLAIALGPGVTEEGFLFTVDGEFLSENGFTTENLEEAMVEVQSRAAARLGDKLNKGLIGT